MRTFTCFIHLWTRPPSNDQGTDGRQWSPRSTLLFCLGVPLLLWGGLAIAALR